MIRRELGDRQWKCIEKLVSGKQGGKARAGEDNRLFVDGVLWIAGTGAPWRDLPSAFGQWNSVYVRRRAPRRGRDHRLDLGGGKVDPKVVSVVPQKTLPRRRTMPHTTQCASAARK